MSWYLKLNLNISLSHIVFNFQYSLYHHMFLVLLINQNRTLSQDTAKYIVRISILDTKSFAILQVLLEFSYVHKTKKRTLLTKCFISIALLKRGVSYSRLIQTLANIYRPFVAKKLSLYLNLKIIPLTRHYIILCLLTNYCFLNIFMEY